ncbi:CinA family protein [Brachybacterium hainanense]|uniref:CinA family protein n=1 Tax=Brachybacterium hainanense TaxID=1541174 RepID=A0ABV6RGL7_9MICO
MSGRPFPAEAARAVVEAAADRGLVLATAESLTGGAVVARLVDVPGASRCLAGGAACYSYEAKQRVLGVDAELLARDGAVTAQVAEQMARGALEVYGADLAVSTTGVAGPGPDARGVAAGTVHLGLACREADAGDVVRIRVRTAEHRFAGDRAAVRAQAVDAAIALLRDALGAEARPCA